MLQNNTCLGNIKEPVWLMLRQLFKSLCGVNLMIIQKGADLELIDLGFRTYFEDSEEQYQNLFHFADACVLDHYYICQDPYLHNYIIVRCSKYPDEILSIGPFLISEPTEYFFNRVLLTSKHIDVTNLKYLKHFYTHLPVIKDELSLIEAAAVIFSYADIDASDFRIARPQLHPDPDVKAHASKEFTSKSDAGRWETRAKLENQVLSALVKGDYTNASKHSKYLMEQPIPQRIENNLLDTKIMFYALNALFRKAAESSGVHPYYCYQVNSKYIQEINTASSVAQLKILSGKILHSYCLLVQNKRHENCSPVVSSAINEIDLHLGSPISLESIARKLNVNKNYLSRTFHKEMGQTLTNYINSERIHISLNMLLTTNASITEIASNVGIYDVNYYTKLFKKIYGKTPSMYRKEVSGIRGIAGNGNG